MRKKAFSFKRECRDWVRGTYQSKCSCGRPIDLIALLVSTIRTMKQTRLGRAVSNCYTKCLLHERLVLGGNQSPPDGSTEKTGLGPLPSTSSLARSKICQINSPLAIRLLRLEMAIQHILHHLCTRELFASSRTKANLFACQVYRVACHCPHTGSSILLSFRITFQIGVRYIG